MKKIIKFLKAKKFFRPPLKKKYLILDSSQSFIFNDYLKFSETNIMDTRYESINLYLLFKTFVNLKFSFKHYIEEYIKSSGCDIIISFIDNNVLYYQLKIYFPKKNYFYSKRNENRIFF